jgi:hypothetical protein
MNKFDELGDIIEDIPLEEEVNKKDEYYTLDRIKTYKCQYNLIFGKRSNGKTYAVLYEGIKNYCNTGKQMAYLRRYREDFVGKRGQNMFAALVSTGAISQLSNGKWDSVSYRSSQWFLSRHENKDRIVLDSSPFCYGFSLGQMEHDKSTAYPDVTTIVFDEFISRIGYLPNEFVLFMNVLSTIIRQRNDVTIYMLGNTVNKYCPYFQDMGLGHIENMESGSIDVYTYGNSKLKVAVERTQNHNIEGRKSDVYFAFDNPALEMITGGAWELDLHPHLPKEYETDDIVFIFFILFNNQLIQCEIIELDDCSFIYCHRKTSEIRHPDEDIIFSEGYDPRPNYIHNMRRSDMPIVRTITHFFANDKVYYQDNDVGEIIRNYLIFCRDEKI